MTVICTNGCALTKKNYINEKFKNSMKFSDSA